MLRFVREGSVAICGVTENLTSPTTMHIKHRLLADQRYALLDR